MSSDPWVRVHETLFRRLVAAAENHFARLGRGPDDDVPQGVISSWLTALENARTMPTPSAEPGDLLVKVGRAEFWTFTVHGWRELAPLELQDDPALHHAVHAATTATSKEGGPGLHFDERTGFSSGGACPRHGVYSGPVCPDCRREAQSAVHKIVDEIQDREQRLSANPDPVPPEARAALDELQQHAEVLEHVADALASGRDGGNDWPLFEAVAQARTFTRALEYARGIIWKHATRRQGSS